MEHQIELAYLVLEVPEPDIAHARASPTSSASSPASRPAGALTWRNDDRAQRLVVQPGPANDAVAVGFEAVDAAAFDATVARLRAIGADVADGTDDDARDAARQPPRPHDRTVGCRRRARARARRRGDAVLVAARARRLPHRRRRLRSRRVRHDRVRRVAPLPHRRPRARAVRLARDGARARHRPRGALLPLQRAAPHASRWPARRSSCRRRLHHVMFETNDARRRRRRVRPGVGDRARRSRTGSAGTTTTGCSASTCRRPAGFQIEVGHGAARRSPTTGTTTAATTASARGATSRCARREHRRATRRRRRDRRRRAGRAHARDPARAARTLASSCSSGGPRRTRCPRAVHFDHEVGRILQSCGIGDELRAISEPAEVYEWRNAAGTTLLRFGRIGDGRVGLAGLVDVLPARARGRCSTRAPRTLPALEVRRGVEVDRARAARRPRRRQRRRGGDAVRARYVVGCDGANSTVRDAARHRRSTTSGSSTTGSSST